MSRNYKFHNPDGVYFVSFAVVEWLDVFTRNEYKNIVLDSLHYCQQNKGMEIFAWWFMTSHVHLIFRSASTQKPELLLGDFKRFKIAPRDAIARQRWGYYNNTLLEPV